MAEQTDIAESLAYEVFRWLAFDPSYEEVAQYVHQFPDNQREILPEVGQALLDLVRFERRQLLNRQFRGNLLKVLDELSLVQFLQSCISYSPESVIRNFQKKFPSLEVTAVAVDPDDLREEIEVWQRTLYFLAALRREGPAVHLKSLIGLARSKEQYQELKDGIASALQAAREEYTKLGLTYTVLEPVVATRIKEALTKLDFLPKETINSLVQLSEIERLMRLLEELYTAIRVVVNGMAMEIPLSNGDSYQSLLLTELKDETEASIYGKTRTSSRALALEPHYQFLASVITLEKLRNGAYKTELTTYKRNLPADQQEAFSKVFQNFCEKSVELQAFCEPLELGPIFERLRSLPGIERQNYIRTLQPYVMPEAWPIVEPFLLLSAELI